jgi:hypothetical protein
MITLAELRTQCRERADMVESQFVTDSELDNYINKSIAALHDLLIGAYNEEYFMEQFDFTSTGTITRALPADFYKLRGVDVYSGGYWCSVKRFNFNRRNAQSFTANLLGLSDLQYRLVGSNIRFNFAPDVGQQFRLFYHPVAPVLTDPTDEYDDANQYAEFVIVDVAIKMLNKEESDTQVLVLERQAVEKRIVSMAQNRDANEPESVSDIYAEQMDTYFIRGSGQ